MRLVACRCVCVFVVQMRPLGLCVSIFFIFTVQLLAPRLPAASTLLVSLDFVRRQGVTGSHNQTH